MEAVRDSPLRGSFFEITILRSVQILYKPPQRSAGRVPEIVHCNPIYIPRLGLEFATWQEWKTLAWDQAKKLAGNVLESLSTGFRKGNIGKN